MRIRVAVRRQENEEQNDLEGRRREKLRNPRPSSRQRATPEAGSLRDKAGRGASRKREPALCPGMGRPDRSGTVGSGSGQGCVATDRRSGGGGGQEGHGPEGEGAPVQWELALAPSLGSNFGKEASFVHLHARSHRDKARTPRPRANGCGVLSGLGQTGSQGTPDRSTPALAHLRVVCRPFASPPPVWLCHIRRK